MTFVTVGEIGRRKQLFCCFQFRFQRLQVNNRDIASVNSDHAFGLEARKIPGNEFADGTDL